MATCTQHGMWSRTKAQTALFHFAAICSKYLLWGYLDPSVSMIRREQACWPTSPKRRGEKKGEGVSMVDGLVQPDSETNGAGDL